MIKRTISAAIQAQIGKYSVFMISGPRQSGKTTLIKELFPDMPYFSLENPDVRTQIQDDPKALFKNHGHRMVIDEVQRAPELLSYIQGIVDDDRESLFVLSGSQNYLMMEGVSQTLAGRVSIFYLQPLSYEELNTHGEGPLEINNLIWQGGYPRIYDRNLSPEEFFDNYIETYVQRDVRLIQNVGNLDLFNQFLAVCATFAGQTLNLSAITKSIGISHATASNWLSLLEASFLVYKVSPYFRNFKKRIVKSPKLYFRDTGLACALLRIRSPEALLNYYQKGALFENFIINEICKTYFNRGKRPPIYYWRDSNQREIDLLLDLGTAIRPFEIKSGMTYSKEYFKHLNWFADLSDIPIATPTVIYGGEQNWPSEYGRLISWRKLALEIE